MDQSSINMFASHTPGKAFFRIQKLYKDPLTNKTFQFLTNNFRLSPLTIANYYRQRWQIETLFKRLKRNYPLKYFLGDSENATKIQIWSVLIADLLLKVIRKKAGSRMSFS